MAPSSLLVQFLADYDTSLTPQLLALLPPASLGALSASCRGLRTVLASLPETTWQADVSTGYATCHPLFRAPSVRAYLQQQHNVQRNISCEICTARELHGARGCLSPDLNEVASVGPDGRLQICAAVTGLLLRTWDLPSHLHMVPASGWGWHSATGNLILLSGPRWLRQEAFVMHSGDATLGIAFVNTHSGHVKVISQPEAADEGLAFYCRTSGRVLVEWTHDEDDEHFAIYESSGHELSRLTIPGPGPVETVACTWAPSGNALILQCNQRSWLWTQEDPGELSPLSDHADGPTDQLSWAVPFSNQVFWQDCEGGPVITTCTPGLVHVELGGLHDGVLWYPFWGVRLGALVWNHRSDAYEEYHLQLYTVQGNSLRLEHAVTAGDSQCFQRSAMLVSADGQLAAALVGTRGEAHGETLVDLHLAVIRLDSGALAKFSIHGLWAEWEPSSNPDVSLRWSCDFSAIAVTKRSSNMRQVYDFGTDPLLG